MNTKIILLAFFGFAFACSQQEPQQEGSTEQPHEAYEQTTGEEVAHSVDSLPQTKEADISIEGMEETQTLQLFDQRNSHYPIQFYTYYPENFTTETVSSGEGDGFIFMMNEARTSLTILPDKAVNSPQEMDTLAKQLLKASGAVDIYKQHGVWNGHTDERIMNIDAAQAPNGRYYYWFTQFPYEYADGFAPRYSLILQEFEIVK